MMKQFIRRILCQIDFWYYVRDGKPLTGIKYYKEDVPKKYWGRNLLRATEFAPYFIIHCQDPRTIKLTEEDKKWAKKMWEERKEKGLSYLK